jgi:sugar fermentation stimulation protein A
MKSCFSAGDSIWLSPSNSPTRKLKWTWELVETTGGYIGVNTARPNLICEDAIKAAKIPELLHYTEFSREVKYGKNSRIDLLLSSPNKAACYVEVKNTTLLKDNKVMFPDSVSERGQKHLLELIDVVKGGKRGVILFLINRPEGDFFCPADDIDPKYGSIFRSALLQGVEALAYRSVHSLEGTSIGEKVNIVT